MRPAMTVEIPLSKAFRYWAYEGELKPAYELKMQVRCERDIDKRKRYDEQANERVRRANRDLWKRLEWDCSLVATGIKHVAGMDRGREKLEPELLSRLSPNFANSTAAGELITF